MWYIEDAIDGYKSIISTIQNNICGYYVDPSTFLHNHNCEERYIRICKSCNIIKMQKEIKRLETFYCLNQKHENKTT